MGHAVDDPHEDLLGLEVPGGVDADAPVTELGPVPDPDPRQDHKLALEVVEIHELLLSQRRWLIALAPSTIFAIETESKC